MEQIFYVFNDDLDDLDLLSNQVIDLIKQNQFDKAEKVCHELKSRFHNYVDWRDRFGLLYEKRGEYAKAIDFYRQAIKFAQTQEGFDEDFFCDIQEKINKLEKFLQP